MCLFDKFIKDNETQFIGPVMDETIKNAEQLIGIEFPEAYKNYLRKYGCLSYKYLEFYGLGVPENSHLNLCSVTKELRSLKLPHGYFAFENLDDGHYAICNKEGDIFEWSPETMDNKMKQISDSFDTYLFQKLEFAKNN